MTLRRALLLATILGAALALVAGATLPPGPPLPGLSYSEPVQIGAARARVTWALPSGPARATIVLQHGYTRRCANLRHTAWALAQAGFLVMCLDAPMTAGNPALADALAAALSAGTIAPGGAPLPPRIIVAGHSAGGRFAARLGAALDQATPDRLAGAVLFDPVGTPGFAADLRAVSRGGRRPVLAVMAAAHRCNAQLGALDALLPLRHGASSDGGTRFVGLQLKGASSHLDVEGEDTDWWAALACERPAARSVLTLRRLAVRWAEDLAEGRFPTFDADPGARELRPSDDTPALALR